MLRGRVEPSPGFEELVFAGHGSFLRACEQRRDLCLIHRLERAHCFERLIEGDRRERMKKAKAPLTPMRVAEIVAKHTLWLMIAWWTGGAWVLYFADAPTLVKQLATGEAPFVAYLWIGILTFTTYTLAGYMREQVCVYMCPWPRIQAALTDEWALNVTYRYDRGEPRTSVKKAEELREKGEPAGDCVDCFQCVAVCPTHANREFEGADPRWITTVQDKCIGCGTCVEVCPNNHLNGGQTLRVVESPTTDWFVAVEEFMAKEPR